MLGTYSSPKHHWDLGITSPSKAGIPFNVGGHVPQLNPTQVETYINFSTTYFNNINNKLLSGKAQLDTSKIRLRIPNDRGIPPIQNNQDFHFAINRNTTKKASMVQHLSTIGKCLRHQSYKKILQYLQENETNLHHPIFSFIGYLVSICIKDYQQEFKYYNNFENSQSHSSLTQTTFFHYFHIADELLNLRTSGPNGLLLELLLPNHSLHSILSNRPHLIPNISPYRFKTPYYSTNFLMKLTSEYEQAKLSIPPLLPLSEINSLQLQNPLLVYSVKTISDLQEMTDTHKIPERNDSKRSKNRKQTKYNNNSIPFEISEKNSREISEKNSRENEIHRNANELITLGKYKEAIHEATEGLKISPKNVSLYIHRAVALKQLGLTHASILDVTEAINLKPNLKIPRKLRASLWLDIGETELAINDLNSIVDKEKLKNILNEKYHKSFDQLLPFDQLKILVDLLK